MQLKCEQHLVSKLLIPGILLVFAVLNILGMLNNSQVIWVILILALPLAFVTSPDFTITDEGLTVHFLWGNRFNTWDQVRMIHTPVNARVFARNLTIFNWVIGLGRSSFVVTRLGRSNYDEAIEAIRNHIPAEKYRKTRY